jgi:hypothetical protein
VSGFGFKTGIGEFSCGFNTGIVELVLGFITGMRSCLLVSIFAEVFGLACGVCALNLVATATNINMNKNFFITVLNLFKINYSKKAA